MELEELISRTKPFGDHYRISAFGDVYSSARGGWRKLHPSVSAKGYLTVDLSVNGVTRKLRLNRIVCEAYHGPPPFEGAVARHLDDDRSRNHQSNLAWGTVSENVQDAVRNGRHSSSRNGKNSAHKISGEGAARAKLTWALVENIRRRRKNGERLATLATDFNVDISNISQICLNKTWVRSSDV